ncbi:MAG: hypothetical protein KDB27_22190, partial [Planctomycetales bacterium]|nr:hypothetical protein [Planctomycetales bacterium]
GVLAAIAPNGEQDWFCFDEGWHGLVSVDIDLSSNHSTAQVTGVRQDGSNTSSTVRVSGNSDVRILGDMIGGMLVRMNGTAESFNLDPNAVDEAFGGN